MYVEAHQNLYDQGDIDNPQYSTHELLLEDVRV